MLLEANDRQTLARGMQGFQVSAAKHINTALGDGVRRRRGKVFADRYHAEVITSPTQARNAIRYVLSNWRRHKEDRSGLAATWLVDPFSSGILFPDRMELQDQPWMWPMRATYAPSWFDRRGAGCSRRAGNGPAVRSARVRSPASGREEAKGRGAVQRLSPPRP